MLLGMSQESLAEYLGLTFQQVQKYEKGINRIGASRLFELANALGVNVQFFYDGLLSEQPPAREIGFSEDPRNNYGGSLMESREIVELNKAFTKIADLQIRRSIINLVRSLSDKDERDGSPQ